GRAAPDASMGSAPAEEDPGATKKAAAVASVPAETRYPYSAKLAQPRDAGKRDCAIARESAGERIAGAVHLNRMHLFGLDPDSIVSRVNSSSSAPRIPSLAESMAVGSLGFAGVSAVAFGVWAWGGRWLHAQAGELGLHAACAAVLIGGGGGVFSRLVIDPERLRRSYALFALAFFLYAGVWTGSYFSLRNRSGEWLGAVLGPAILGMTLANAFGATTAVRKVVVIVVVTHLLGYFAGGFLYEGFPSDTGKLLWGAAYGLGFGAGIGYALYTCQTEVRQRLREQPPLNHD
ncbi:MAG TPA: hypothetical protein VJW76_16250, partial [Verrucomicrobiae bacterium]|nr:hypothetical protein [Verrucomicrobiae bacterium]